MKFYMLISCFTLFSIPMYSLQDTSSINKEIITFLINEGELDTTSSTPLGFLTFELVKNTQILNDNNKIGIYRLSSGYSHAWIYIILKKANDLEFLVLHKDFNKDFNRVIEFAESNNLYTDKELLKGLKSLVKSFAHNLKQ